MLRRSFLGVLLGLIPIGLIPKSLKADSHFKNKSFKGAVVRIIPSEWGVVDDDNSKCVDCEVHRFC